VTPIDRGPFDRGRDLPALLELVSRARATDPRAFLHPGGLQWLLRRLAAPSFSVRHWHDAGTLTGVVIIDGGAVIVQPAVFELDRHLWLLAQTEKALRDTGTEAVEISIWDGDDELIAALRSRGYRPAGTFGHELIRDGASAPRPVLPDGFSWRWLEPELDDAYVALHRAAWSTWAPSTYIRSMHDAVTAMPDFDRTMVPIAVAPDGTLAAGCFGWLDPRTGTVEIEPLGTHPRFRRMGLGRAIVDEVVRRSIERRARSVLVWGVSANPVAVQLYGSAGFTSRRVLREYRRTL